MSAILEKTYTRSVMNGSGVYTKLNVFHLHDGTYDVIFLSQNISASTSYLHKDCLFKICAEAEWLFL